MAKQTDQGVQWAEEIRKEAAKTVKAVMDKLVSVDRAAFRNLGSGDKKAVMELAVNEVIRAMLRLGTFLTTGGSEATSVHIEQVTLKGDAIKFTLKALPPFDIRSIAENSKKDGTLCYVNHLAFQQAKDMLIQAVHRDQMDWLNVPKGDAELFPDPEGEAAERAQDAADAEADRETAKLSEAAQEEREAQADEAHEKSLDAGEWKGDDLSQAPTPQDDPDFSEVPGVEPISNEVIQALADRREGFSGGELHT